MQASAFLAFHRLSGYQVTDVNHIAEFAKFAGCFATLEETFRFFIQDVQTVPGTDEADVATDNAHVSFHYLIHFLHALGDEYSFFGILRTLGIPLRKIFIEFITIDHT